MKKILVLDDDQNRHDRYATIFTGDHVDHAYSLEDFQTFVDTQSPYDMIFFDHDLGHETPVGQNALATPGTGADAVKYLLSAVPPSRWPKMAVVHSINVPAATKMVDRLKAAGIPSIYKPFQAAP